MAQKVLQGQTRGYQKHPQLQRFKDYPHPLHPIAFYLQGVYLEANRRGYSFKGEKIGPIRGGQLPVKRGQILFEYHWLRKKLKDRSPLFYDRLPDFQGLLVHPLFYVVEGGREEWEKGLLEEVDHGFFEAGKGEGECKGI